MKYKLMVTSITSVLMLGGCGDAETNIVELDPIAVPDEDHGHDDDHDHDSEYEIESEGRLVVADNTSNSLTVFDLDNNSALDTFETMFEGSSLSASAGYRYAVINNRSNNLTEFLDGGLWREDHVAHLHDYKEAPALVDFSMTGSSPTHLVSHDGQLAVFYDGDAQANIPSAVKVVTDTDIASDLSDLPTLDFSVNMHGVAEPRGDMLISTFRRDDAETLSATALLPDSVVVYHFHGDEYEEEQRFDGACPDLHGAAQNELAVAFGCSDGVLVLTQDDDVFTNVFINNIDALNDVRIGTMYGHEAVSAFVGIASSHGGGSAILANVSPVTNTMSIIDWQPSTDASPVAYTFTHEGEYFAILDDKGFVTLLEAHEESDDTHWEFAHKIDVASESVASLAADEAFSMTASQYEARLFITNPVTQEVLSLEIESENVEPVLSLDFVPSSAVWVGIAEAHDH